MTQNIIKQDIRTFQKLSLNQTSDFSKVFILFHKISAIEALYGRCTQCVCPGFQGSEYECTRGGCHHHYDEHSANYS